MENKEERRSIGKKTGPPAAEIHLEQLSPVMNNKEQQRIRKQQQNKETLPSKEVVTPDRQLCRRIPELSRGTDRNAD